MSRTIVNVFSITLASSISWVVWWAFSVQLTCSCKCRCILVAYTKTVSHTHQIASNHQVYGSSLQSSGHVEPQAIASGSGNVRTIGDWLRSNTFQATCTGPPHAQAVQTVSFQSHVQLTSLQPYTWLHIIHASRPHTLNCSPRGYANASSPHLPLLPWQYHHPPLCWKGFRRIQMSRWLGFWKFGSCVSCNCQWACLTEGKGSRSPSSDGFIDNRPWQLEPLMGLAASIAHTFCGASRWSQTGPIVCIMC